MLHGMDRIVIALEITFILPYQYSTKP